MKNSGKIAELKVQMWFLEAGWPVFHPVVDENQMDIVVQQPKTKKYFGIQVKHSEPKSKNPGYLDLRKRKSPMGFDFIVFILPNGSVIILPRRIITKPLTILCNKKTGMPTPEFQQYACREDQFIEKLTELMAQENV